MTNSDCDVGCIGDTKAEAVPVKQLDAESLALLGCYGLTILFGSFLAYRFYKLQPPLYRILLSCLCTAAMVSTIRSGVLVSEIFALHIDSLARLEVFAFVQENQHHMCLAVLGLLMNCNRFYIIRCIATTSLGAGIFFCFAWWIPAYVFNTLMCVHKEIMEVPLVNIRELWWVNFYVYGAHTVGLVAIALNPVQSRFPETRCAHDCDHIRVKRFTYFKMCVAFFLLSMLRFVAMYFMRVEGNTTAYYRSQALLLLAQPLLASFFVQWKNNNKNTKLEKPVNEIPFGPVEAPTAAPT